MDNNEFSLDVVASNLKELRLKKNMSQQDVADLIQINRSTYGWYEQAKVEPKISALFKIAKVFNTSVDSLLKRNEETKNNTTTSAFIN